MNADIDTQQHFICRKKNDLWSKKNLGFKNKNQLIKMPKHSALKSDC